MEASACESAKACTAGRLLSTQRPGARYCASEAVLSVAVVVMVIMGLRQANLGAAHRSAGPPRNHARGETLDQVNSTKQMNHYIIEHTLVRGRLPGPT